MVKTVARRLVLHFPSHLIDQPVISRLIKSYNVELNILKAMITPKEEGVMVAEISGEESSYKKAIDYLKELGVSIQMLSQDIVWNEEKCTHCGACVTICPTGALYIDKSTWLVSFDASKCVACELCINACPPRAMEVRF